MTSTTKRLSFTTKTAPAIEARRDSGLPQDEREYQRRLAIGRKEIARWDDLAETGDPDSIEIQGR